MGFQQSRAVYHENAFNLGTLLTNLAPLKYATVCAMILGKAVRHSIRNRIAPNHNVLFLPSRYRSDIARPLTSILIANRGEIALWASINLVKLCLLTLYRRVGRTASKYGIRCTTIYTDPDAKSQHALSTPFSVNLGDASAYLDGDKIIKAAKEHGCLAIHPGYGFVRLM